MLISNSKHLLIPLRHLFSHFSSNKMFWILGNKTSPCPVQSSRTWSQCASLFQGYHMKVHVFLLPAMYCKAEIYVCHRVQVNRASFSCLCFKRFFFKPCQAVSNLWNIVYDGKMMRNICFQTWFSKAENLQHTLIADKNCHPVRIQKGHCRWVAYLKTKSLNVHISKCSCYLLWWWW